MKFNKLMIPILVLSTFTTMCSKSKDKNGKREGKHLTTVESGRGQYIINYVKGKPGYSKGQYKDLATGIIIEGKLSDYNDIDNEEYFYDESSYILFNGDINLEIAPIEVIRGSF